MISIPTTENAHTEKFYWGVRGIVAYFGMGFLVLYILKPEILGQNSFVQGILSLTVGVSYFTVVIFFYRRCFNDKNICFQATLFNSVLCTMFLSVVIFLGVIYSPLKVKYPFDLVLVLIVLIIIPIIYLPYKKCKLKKEESEKKDEEEDKEIKVILSSMIDEIVSVLNKYKEKIK